MASDSDPFLQLVQLEDYFNFPLPIKTNDFTPANFEKDPHQRFIRNPAKQYKPFKTPRIRQDPINNCEQTKTLPFNCVFGWCTLCNQLLHTRERVTRPAKRTLNKPGAQKKKEAAKVELKIIGRDINEFIRRR